MTEFKLFYCPFVKDMTMKYTLIITFLQFYVEIRKLATVA